MTAEEVNRMTPRQERARLALDALVDVLVDALVALDGAFRAPLMVEMGFLVEEGTDLEVQESPLMVEAGKSVHGRGIGGTGGTGGIAVTGRTLVD